MQVTYPHSSWYLSNIGIIGFRACTDDALLCLPMLHIRFKGLRKRHLLARHTGRKTCHERCDIENFVVSRDTTFSEMFSELTWYSLDRLALDKLGEKHKLRTAKQKREWAESQGWTITENKEGVEGVAFHSQDEGIMKMRVGSRFSAEKVRKEGFEQSEASLAH
jgi:hypothetical protein